LLRAKGVEQSADHHQVLSEIISLLPLPNDHISYQFINTKEDNPARLFEYGCDHLVKRFDEAFDEAFENTKTEVYERV
jgi:hypothetical protein